MDATRMIQVAVARADLLLCRLGRWAAVAVAAMTLGLILRWGWKHVG